MDSDKLFEVAKVANEFGDFGPTSAKNPRGPSIEVAVAYPTEKKQKIAPLREAIKSHIKKQEEKRKISINITEFFFKVKDTGVGEQPLHPGGCVGALNRIKYVQDALLNPEWKQSFARPAIEDFRRIIIPSLESDLYGTAKGIYDKPNVVFCECITKHFVAGMGAGPYVEKDIFKLSQRLGNVLFNDLQAVTYGKTVQTLFPHGHIDHADWHRAVCRPLPDGTQRDRAYFIKQLCDALDQQLELFFDKIFDP